jgi:gliding motility-associated-like protein
MNLDLASTDAEGDQLTYELCAPLAGGGPSGLNSVGDPMSCNGIRPNPALCPPPLTAVNYSSPGTTALNPFPSAIPITFTNGILRALPNMVGQYVFGICIKEYRNGILLSVQQREMQINIDVCSSPTASIQADRTSNDTAYIRICDPDEEFRIINTTSDTQLIKSISWEFTPPSGANWTDSTFDFTRTLPDTGLYTGLMILNKGNQCSDSIHIRLKVNPKLEVRPDAQYDSCRFDPIQFGSMVISGHPVRFEWDFGDSSRSDLPDPVHAYNAPGLYLIRFKAWDEEGCISNLLAHLSLFPAPPDFSLSISDSVVCYPDTLRLGIAGISDPSYNYRWELSNGTVLTGPSPRLGVNTAGRFDVKAILISKNGCRSEKTFSILGLESPVADFDLGSDQLSLRQPDLLVINRSRNASSYRWDFGDGQFSTQINPAYAYQAAGSYTVQLVAFHVNGCSDTVQRPLTVTAASDFYLPNIFTPNGDGQNDVFKPEGIEGFFSGYDFSIFDRWGSLLFFSEDQSQGWDGTRGATNKMALDGVYIYVVRFATEDGEKKIIKGSVTLIR